VELIPRAGDFRIVLGTLDDYEKKLRKFSVFVEKGLNVVGWNRYSVINLSYDKQVVCTKK
jgi:cell division protein FtsQ